MTPVTLNTTTIDLGATMPPPATDALREPDERRIRFEPVPAQRSIVERAYGTSPVTIVPPKRRMTLARALSNVLGPHRASFERLARS